MALASTVNVTVQANSTWVIVTAATRPVVTISCLIIALFTIITGRHAVQNGALNNASIVGPTYLARFVTVCVVDAFNTLIAVFADLGVGTSVFAPPIVGTLFAISTVTTVLTAGWIQVAETV
jgi:hypothetical protein